MSNLAPKIFADEVPEAAPYGDTTVVIPTLNEEHSIGRLIYELIALYPGISVIVADDGSRDETAARVENLHASFPSQVFFLDRRAESKKGLTASVCSGLLAADTQFAVVMDGDLQHPPAEVGRIVSELRAASQNGPSQYGGAEIVVAVRDRFHLAQAPHRALFTLAFTALAGLTLRLRGIRVRDPMSGFFGVATEYAHELLHTNGERFVGEGYKILFDMLRMGRRGQPVREIVYRFGIRSGGGSKASYRHAYHFIRSLFS